MTTRSVTHATFTIDRTYDASPERVFRAFADVEAKRRWFHGPDEWGPEQHEMDFRVGGREYSAGGPKGGPTHVYDARYYDIVPNERIVYAYDMLFDDRRISVSLAAIELSDADGKTRLVLTEHGAYLDGYDDAGAREEGTRGLLDALDASLRETAGASTGT